jgi:DNA-binding NtrC family response regulator
MSSDLQSSRGMVLIAEDEPMILFDTADTVERAGFEVVVAGDAAEAIAVLETHDNIRVMFTDVNMPGSMDGQKLAHVVRGRWQSIKIIVTTGYGHIAADELPAGGLLIAKPYNAETLVRALTRATQ